MDEAPRLLLWGVPELRAGPVVAFGPERRFQLLALLGVKSGEWVPRDRIAALLWPEHSNFDARRNLRNVVFKAREVPGTGELEASEHALRWTVATDLQAFDRALRGRGAIDALALRRGPPLSALDDPRNDALGAWLAEERRRIEARWHDAALDHLGTLGDPSARRALAQQLLQIDPLDEAAVTAWIEAALALGQTGAAQQIFRDYRQRLAEELGVEPSRRLRDLLRDGMVGTSTTADLAASSAQPEGGFVGRRSELSELAGRLGQPDGRLVTLLGPGGIGKSRLARQVQERVRASFPGGAWWVELQDLVDSSAALARLAAQLGVGLDGRRDPVERIAERLAGQATLVVFDNAEHLPEIGLLADRLLAVAPGLAVLLTSRTRTRSVHEWPVALAGLDVPDDDSRDLDAASAFDAVRLFDVRARAARRSFGLAEHVAAVIDIVEAVGGVPLAIELAAAWVRLLPPEEIARQLRGSLAVLERDPALPGEPDRPEHRSLRVVLERTWQLLAPAERAALDSLAVFHGGFTAGAAQAVAGVPLPLLSSLVDQSVVAVDETGRFGLHPLVASVAGERLGADAERRAMLERLHAEYFARALADLAPHARGDHRVLLAGIDAEYANARRAWSHAVDTGRADLVQAMITAWRTYFDVRGRFTEGVALLRPVLEWSERDVETQQAIAAVRNALSLLLYRKGDLALSRTVAEAGVQVAERCGDRRALVGCLSSVGSCHSLAGRWQDARPYFERALQVAQEDGQRAEMAAAFTNLGICAKKDGRFQEALEYYDRALAIDRELGHHDAVARRLNNIGNVHMELCDWVAARQIMAQGLQHCEQYRVESMRPYFEASLGLTNFELGEIDAAEPHLHRAYALACATDTMTIQISSQSFLARIESLRGRAAEALVRLQAVATSAQTSGNATDVLDTALYYGEWLRDRGRRIEAARVWRMVIDHPIAEAGIRDGTRKWAAALQLSDDEAAEAGRHPVSLDGAIAALRAERVDGKR